MDEQLEKKLHESMDMVSKILNEDVVVYFININNGAILINSKTADIVNFILKKEHLGKVDYKDILGKYLNIEVTNVKEVPFEIYNDYSRRYYIIDLNKNNILNLDSSYIYTNINSIEDSISLKVIKELLK